MAIIVRQGNKMHKTSSYIMGSIGLLLLNGALTGDIGWVASVGGLVTVVYLAGFVDACFSGRVFFDMGHFLGTL